MRILGFSKKWDKLNKQWFERDLHTFTTFRYPRRDRNWEVEEIVQIVYKPRSKEREPLGIARIIQIEQKDMSKNYRYYPKPTNPNTPDVITPLDAYEDGFSKMGHGDIKSMIDFIKDWSRPPIINKLTLCWIERFNT